MVTKSSIGRMFRYESFITIGIVMAIATLIKLLGFADFSSDWFWFIAGLGLVLEGFISLSKQKQFDKKFKVIEIESAEYKKLYKNKR
jgi:hypothetical protein